MSTKHTPGPWYVEDDERGILTTVTSDYGDIDYLTLPNHRANACIIAAAPELLEALEAIVNRSEVDHEVCIRQPDYDRALAAINKAKGE